jgi:hypothetical protein
LASAPPFRSCFGSALVGLAQFLHRWRESVFQHAETYAFIVDGRITGFASHWMTFGGEEMIVLIMIISVLFPGRPRWSRFLWPAAILIWASIGLGVTRCVFLLGLPLGILFLAWKRRKRYAAVFVLGSFLGTVLAPAPVRKRIVSVVRPHAGIDSNAHRAVCRIVGWQNGEVASLARLRARTDCRSIQPPYSEEYTAPIATRVVRPSTQSLSPICSGAGTTWLDKLPMAYGRNSV